MTERKTFAEEEAILWEASRKYLNGEISLEERRALSERYGPAASFLRGVSKKKNSIPLRKDVGTES